MLFWTIILILTAAGVMSVLLPLGRARRAEDRGSAPARSVYLDQIAELERERAEGRIAAEDAEATRAEIARRLIALDRDGPGPRSPSSPASRRAVSVLALCGIPLVSLSLYLALGAPHLPGQPLAARQGGEADGKDLAALVGQVEQHLARAPEDGQGWDVIAPIYFRLGRFEDAARAYSNAARLLGSTAAREAGLGEAIVATQAGVVTAEAREAFTRAVAADPDAASARYFLALAKEQEGRTDEAAADLRSLLASARADAPWRPMVEQNLARLEASPSAGPAAEDVAAAESMAEPEQRAMIEGMVARLAERLGREPGDVEGWLRLVRAYDVLGRPEDATNAARTALRSLAAPDERKRVEMLVADLGLSVAETGTP